MQEYSPITVFTYNRPDHTKKTVEALQKNKLAGQSDLIIFSDAAKGLQDLAAVEKVRIYIKSITGFKSVKIVERSKNWGLADSIICGVTQTVRQYGSVIVLEDDIVTSPYFLNYMNDALNYFKEEKKVWHISGWNYPFDNEGLGDIFFWRLMNCWGWATWKDRWNYFEKDAKKLIHEFNKKTIYDFDLSNSGQFWSQVIANHKGKMNTWAIFWYATIFKQKGLCLNPSTSYVKNIGHDGSGVHCMANRNYLDNTLLNEKKKPRFNIPLKESEIAIERVIRFYRDQKRCLIDRIETKLCRFCHFFKKLKN